MPLIASREIWTRQPQNPVQLDLSSALGRRVIGGCIPGVVSFADGGVSTRSHTGVGSLGVGVPGEAYAITRCSPSVSLPGRQGGNPKGPEHSLLFVITTAASGTEWLYDPQGLESTAEKLYLSNGQITALFPNGGYHTGGTASAGEAVIIISSGSAISGATPESPEFWINGSKSVSGVAIDGWSATNSFSGFFGSVAYPTSNRGPTVGYLAVVLKGLVTDDEAESLTRNPWQLFQKRDRRLWIPSAGAGDVTIACTPGNATTAGITAGISSATIIACNAGTATTAGISAGISSATTISCNAGTASTAGISAGITQATTIACNAGTATVAGIPAGISLNSSITISCNAGAATTAGVSAVFPQTLSCTPGNATTAGNSATFPQSLSCNVGNATTAGITAQVDIAGQIVIGCNAGTATTAGASANISSAIVLACNAGTATTLGATAYFPQSLQCSPGNAIAVGIDATFTVAGPTTIVCNVGNATASGISFSFAGTLVDAPNGSGPAIIIPRGTRGAVQNTTRPPNIGGIRI